MFGSPGAAVGRYLGSNLANVAGFGDYTIRKNDLLAVEEGRLVSVNAAGVAGIVISPRYSR